MTSIPDSTINELKARFNNLVDEINAFQTTRPHEMMQSKYDELQKLKDMLDSLGVEYGTEDKRRFTRIVKGYT